jgi:hypothetical protein
MTTKDLADILGPRNTNGKYDAIIDRAKNNGYHDHKFMKILDHPEYGECMCPKVQLITDLANFPELNDISARVMAGEFDEQADDDDIAEMRNWLICDGAGDSLFQQMGFQKPTKQERLQVIADKNKN